MPLPLHHNNTLTAIHSCPTKSNWIGLYCIVIDSIVEMTGFARLLHYHVMCLSLPLLLSLLAKFIYVIVIVVISVALPSSVIRLSIPLLWSLLAYISTCYLCPHLLCSDPFAYSTLIYVSFCIWICICICIPICCHAPLSAYPTPVNMH